MKYSLFTTIVFLLVIINVSAQTIEWEGREFEITDVKASIVELNRENVLKVERDLKALPFELENLSNTVDEPTYVKVKNLDIQNGVFEVKMLSRIQTPSPFKGSHGFIGVAFRANEDNSAYESIYLRPNVGRSDNQFARNHTVQYYAYPDYKFDRLRAESKGEFETYADIGLDEWITFRVEFKGKEAKLYLNDQEYASFIVNEMKGKTQSGSIALWVDIGTEGYFKDFKILKSE
ncbi:family 16 glycoside hydrolase [Maribacter algicola]|uniref:family 16 glycoside hydrolase n=1 Tax=Maribacter algicola TaxID=2498892 RepID=UPI001A9F0E2A|nr:family 16 glycoside hydrolase [Maribacter algicola]